MTMMLLVSVICVSAVGPAVLFVVNLRRYVAPEGDAGAVKISVLIPARDEERNIAACVESVLASVFANSDMELEVLVLDDASTDRTGEIVSELAERDARVRLVKTQTLPAGWNGKQRACWLLAQEAQGELLLFLDADVRVALDALRRCAGQMRVSGLQLLSGFPRQITIGFMEQMLLPLIHFVLLSFLPMGRMRKTTDPSFSAGCGQFFLAERAAYFASGGHAAIRETRHDGLRLPEAFRRHGYRTDIFDLTELAQVRMYDSPHAVWMGLAKNATEGMATPGRIVPFTLLLLLGQVLPVVLFASMLTLARVQSVLAVAILLAFLASYVPRLVAVRRFKQPMMAAVLHPVGVVMLLCVQWYALGRQVFGRPVAWRARSYSSETGEEV
jgi:cellulose synthase/poly-beta-1,6-N-acetylglucosamine synthase-like glycosyltransferase